MDKTKLNNLLQLNSELHRFVEAKILQPTHGKNQTEISLLVFSMAKGSKTHLAILNLCDAGFGQDAAILGRSLFELTVNMGYIFNADTDDRIKRYVTKHFVISSKYSKSIKEAAREGAKKYPDYPSEEEIKKLTEEAIELTGNSDKWSGKSIREMAEEVKLKDMYDLLYRLISNLVHSTSSSFTDYLHIDSTKPTQIKIDLGPSGKWLVEALSVAFTSYFHLCELWNQMLHWDVEGELKQFASRFEKIVGME